MARLMYQLKSVCVEIKGDYVEKQHSCLISVTFKSWSGRKILDPTTYYCHHQPNTQMMRTQQNENFSMDSPH